MNFYKLNNLITHQLEMDNKNMRVTMLILCSLQAFAIDRVVEILSCHKTMAKDLVKDAIMGCKI